MAFLNILRSFRPQCMSHRKRVARSINTTVHPWDASGGHCQLIDKIPNKWVKHLTIDLLTPCILVHERQVKSQEIAHSPQFSGRVPKPFVIPLPLCSLTLHLESSSATTICPEGDPCATQLARPVKTGPSPSIFETKPRTCSSLAMARRFSNVSWPSSWPWAFS